MDLRTSQKTPQNNSGSNVLKWISIPPVIAGFTVGITKLLGGGYGGEIDFYGNKFSINGVIFVADAFIRIIHNSRL